ncbi:MAG: hypothetical protein ACFFB5_12225 [Promethearchaeota archaeon]
MIRNITIQRHGVAVLILILGILCSSTIQSNSHPSGAAVDVLQVHQVVNTLTAYQADQFTVSLTIINIYSFKDVLDVSMRMKIPKEVEFLSSSELDLEIKNDSEEFNYNFGTLKIDKSIHFSITYNVTSAETKSVTIEAVNVSYRLENGIIGWILSNTDSIGLRGKKETTTTESLLPIPKGKINEIDFGIFKIPTIPFLSVIGYILPLVFFSISIFVLRRIRYL